MNTLKAWVDPRSIATVQASRTINSSSTALQQLTIAAERGSSRNPRLSPTSVIMKPAPSLALRRPMIALAAGLSLLAAGSIARASAPDAMLQTAETACLAKATSEGWSADASSVVSRRAIDADRVEVVLDLSKDGVNKARLTCPFSARTGVVGQMGALGDALQSGVDRTDFGEHFSRSMATAADASQAVNRSHGWWLLLPIGLAGLSWAALRRRAGEELRYGTGEIPIGGRTTESFIATANGQHGQAEIHELADQHSLVRRRVNNGQMVSLSGRSANGWLEVDGGGWVRESDLNVRRDTRVTASRNS
jgi:hypothetical protein